MILELLQAAARGDFPPEDGVTQVVGAAAGAQAAVLSFTAHHVVAADVPPDEVLAAVDPTNLNGPVAPSVLAWLADRTGLRAGSLDVVLAWVPERASPTALAPQRDRAVHEVSPGDHPRIVRARRWRRDLRVFEGDDGIVVFGRGLADRLELSMEVAPERRGQGRARELVAAALAAAQPSEPVFAQVAAANAASLRALQPAGFVAVGAEVLFGPHTDFLRRADGAVRVGG